MTIRRVLILAPTLLVIILLQSYLWVPTYEQQTRGNPDRLNQYITGSIGDASLLNPILSADSASSNIESKVFEGLIDRDEELRFRGRLATSWEIYEEAFFYINDDSQANAQDVIKTLRQAKKNPGRFSSELKASLENISEITFIAPRTFFITKKEKSPAITVATPAPLMPISGKPQWPNIRA